MIKISPLLFIASVVANAAMLFYVVVGGVARQDVGAGSRGAPDAAAPLQPAPVSTATEAAAGSDEPYAGAWPKLQSSDLQQLAGRLRQEGFPEIVIREIMREQIFRRVDARWKALDPEENTRPFWKFALNEAEIAKGRAEINRERTQMMQEVFSAETDPNYQAMYEWRQRSLDFLPPDKAEQVMALLRKYDTESRPVTMLASRSQAENEKLGEIAAALRQDLAMVLTPAELEDYDLRNSRVANALRSQLSVFDPTEQEFRTLYRLQSAYADRLGTFFGQPTADQIQARTEAQRQLDAEIKITLGDQRYEEYRRASDYSYREAYKVVARLGLPPATTNQVWEIQQDIQKRAGSLDRGLSTDERAQQMAALAGEAQTRVTQLLGDAGFQAYREHGGQWMQILQPRPATTGTPGVPVRVQR
jgi:hypothetical protein